MPKICDSPILITGASRGLGAAFCRALSPHNHIIAAARTIGALEKIDDEIRAKGGFATLAPLDISNENAVKILCDSIAKRWGKLGLWLHCAISAPALSPITHIDKKDLTTSFRVNFFAVQNLITLISPLLEKDGYAVFFRDTHARAPFFGAYGAGKAAQIALAENWAAEAIRTGPKICILEPKPMATATRARFYPGEDKSHLASPAAEALRLLEQIIADKAI